VTTAPAYGAVSDAQLVELLLRVFNRPAHAGDETRVERIDERLVVVHATWFYPDGTAKGGVAIRGRAEWDRMRWQQVFLDVMVQHSFR
jgi:hypothetical protein